jgi:hypothetical protein
MRYDSNQEEICKISTIPSSFSSISSFSLFTFHSHLSFSFPISLQSCVFFTNHQELFMGFSLEEGILEIL